MKRVEADPVFKDTQKYKPQTKVSVNGKLGRVWAYMSKQTNETFVREYWIRYDDGTTGTYKEEELTPIN